MAKLEFWKDSHNSSKTIKKLGICLYYDMDYEVDNLFIEVQFLSKYYRMGIFINKKENSFLDKLVTSYIKKVLKRIN
jgi:hypothetical protein